MESGGATENGNENETETETEHWGDRGFGPRPGTVVGGSRGSYCEKDGSMY